MWAQRRLLNRLVIALFILVFFILISASVLAKTTVDAGEDKTVAVDEEVEFHAKGDGILYSWDFDDFEDDDPDGNFTNDDDASGKKVTHTFKRTGEYIVTLTVYDSNHKVIDVYESEITVEEQFIIDPWLMGLLFVIIGVIMLLAEASSPGFFIGIPATILIVIGMIGIAFPQLFFTIWSPIIAAILTPIVTLTIIYIYKRLAPPEAPTTTVGESLHGKTGIVLKDTEPDNLTKGKVKVGTDIWSATSDEVIKKGAKVVVIASEGVHITVEKFESEGKKNSRLNNRSKSKTETSSKRKK